MRKINMIVLHHTASENTFQQIKNYHINVKRWGEVFYHYVIDRQGILHVGRNINLNSSRQRPGAIEIGVIGHLHLRDIFEVQNETLLNLLDTLESRYDGEIEIVGHKDVSATICPGNLDVGYYRDYWQKISRKGGEKMETTEISWKDMIMVRGVTNGLITPDKHAPDDAAPKWFVVELCNRVLNQLRNN